MMYLRWLLITVYALATTLLAVILMPIVVLLFADHRTGRLASLDGDAGLRATRRP